MNETINNELLGYAPNNDTIVGEMLSTLGLSSLRTETYKAEQLISSGLFTVINGCLEPIYKRRYVMPYWEYGKIVYSIGRLDTDNPDEIAQLPEWNRGKYKKQLVHSEKHPEVSKVVKNVIWNADCVSDYETGSIAEGIVDGLMHKQISDEIGVGVISPVTTKFSKNDYQQLVDLTEIENAISLAQCDDATFNKQSQLAKELVLINEPNAVLPIIGWFFAVPFKWHFMNHPNYHHFPHLNIWGTRGSGKTETVKLLWKVLGYTGKEIPSASQTAEKQKFICGCQRASLSSAGLSGKQTGKVK